MFINCEIGSRGAEDRIDDELMSLIDIACIPSSQEICSLESIRYYQERARELGVKTAAFCSLQEGVDVHDLASLIEGLNEQVELFGDVQCIKFYGPLYHYLNRSAEAAEAVASWLKEKGVNEVIAPYRSMLHKACVEERIPVLYEAYADRRYTAMNVGLELMSQDQIGSHLNDIDDILRQVRKMKQGCVDIEGQNHLIEVETICVDSRSADALDKFRAIKQII